MVFVQEPDAQKRISSKSDGYLRVVAPKKYQNDSGFFRFFLRHKSDLMKKRFDLKRINVHK